MKAELLFRYLVAAAMGASFAYFFDNKRGHSRRVIARDKAKHYINKTSFQSIKIMKDLFNRSKGLFFRMEAKLMSPPTVMDDILVARVRSKIGRVASHPHSIEVKAHDGIVTLQGNCYPYELEDVVRVAQNTRGVRNVKNQLSYAPTLEMAQMKKAS